MSYDYKQTLRSQVFRSVISGFIDERREAKTKGVSDDSTFASKYEFSIWLADAARRVGQIQSVTHVLKATHPDARGSSLHLHPSALQQHGEVGSHLLDEDFAEDVVGNAAALDVYKFLCTEVEGRRLLDWMREGDKDLQLALSDDPDMAREWMESFASLVREDRQPASHVMAKQLYWLAGEEPSEDEAYHLLQPLFSSSLAHEVHRAIQNARFGEQNKVARQAWREGKAYEGAYCDYRNLAIRKLGGTKPQNISQLNSERGGINYLLASLPPKWNSKDRIQVLKVDSVFEGFVWFEDVREQLKMLADFLKVNPEPTKETRDKRKELEQELGLCLAMFGESIRMSREPGWTRESDCRLPLCERLWLDPERKELQVRDTHVEEDEAFNAAYLQGDWPDQVAGRFANWMNAQLHKAGLTTVGDIEYRHWARQAIVEADWPVAVERRAKGGVA